MKTKTLIIISSVLLVVGLVGPSLFSYYILNQTLEGSWFWGITLGWLASSVLIQFILNRRLHIYKNALKKDPDKTAMAKAVIISSSVFWAIIQALGIVIIGAGGFGLVGFLLGLLFSPLINNIYIEGAILTFIYIIALVIYLFRFRILSKVRNL